MHSVVILLYAENARAPGEMSCCRCQLCFGGPDASKEGSTVPSPSIMMHKSSRPACTATVAAPIQKLCPANCSSVSPRSWRACLVICTNFPLVKAVPSRNVKKGPSDVPLALMNAATTATGQRRALVLSIITSVPLAELIRLRVT